jgi:hypothetical protein
MIPRNPKLTGAFRRPKRSPPALTLTASNLASIAWLCEMASIGCDASGRPGWAGQLRADAADLRRLAQGGEPMTRPTRAPTAAEAQRAIPTAPIRPGAVLGDPGGAV